MNAEAVRRVVSRMADIGLWVSAAIGVVAAVASAVMFLSDVRPLVVTSGSMEPSYPVRSLVLVRPVQASSVVERDVVAVRLPSGARVLHRVIDVSTAAGGHRAVVLKGDANAEPDTEPVVLDERAYRAVACVPFVGTVATWLRTPVFGFFAALVLLGPLALRRRTPASAPSPQPA